jgi:hypothetical protein
MDEKILLPESKSITTFKSKVNSDTKTQVPDKWKVSTYERISKGRGYVKHRQETRTSSMIIVFG